MPRTTAAPDLRAIRLIHLSLPLGVLLFVAVAVAVRPAPTAAAPVASVTLAAGVAALVIAQLVRARIPARSAVQPLTEWWTANFGRAVAAWSLIEAGGLLGAVGFWLTGRPLPLAATAAALALFVLTAPSRLTGE
jgi:hypothetical protein